jgi:hypothetical protein
MCVMIPSTLFSDTFLIVRRIQRGMIKMEFDLHVKCPLFVSDFKEILTFCQIFENCSYIKFHENPFVGRLRFSMRTDGLRTYGRTDRQDQFNSHCSQVCERALRLILFISGFVQHHTIYVLDAVLINFPCRLRPTTYTQTRFKHIYIMTLN